MTANQIAYWNLKETERANRAKEFENQRSNIARETETNRSNRAQEAETHRSNTTREAETERSNRTKEVETHRTNVEKEISDRMRAYADLYDIDSVTGALVWAGDKLIDGLSSGKIQTVEDALKYIGDQLTGDDPKIRNKVLEAVSDVMHNTLSISTGMPGIALANWLHKFNNARVGGN